MQQISDQQEREDNKQDEGRELPQKWGRLGGSCMQSTVPGYWLQYSSSLQGCGSPAIRI